MEYTRAKLNISKTQLVFAAAQFQRTVLFHIAIEDQAPYLLDIDSIVSTMLKYLITLV